MTLLTVIWFMKGNYNKNEAPVCPHDLKEREKKNKTKKTGVFLFHVCHVAKRVVSIMSIHDTDIGVYTGNRQPVTSS